MAITSAIILATYFIGLILAMKMSKGPRAGDSAQAEGCAYFFLLMIAGFGLLLGLAVAFHQRWLVVVIFIMTGLPAVLTFPQFAYLLWKRRR